MKLKEQDFAQCRWKVLILESSHCLGFLPFASCYITSKTGSTKIAVKTHKCTLKHPYASLHRLSILLLLASSAFSLLRAHSGGRLRVLCSGGYSRALVLLSVSLWRALVFMPAVYIVSVSFSFPFALSACLVCFAMAVSM